MVVCGGYSEPEIVRHVETGRKWGKTGSPLPEDDGVRVFSRVLRLDMAALRWDAMPVLRTATYRHVCCTVRGGVVVIGGDDDNYGVSSRVEVLARGADAFASLSPLWCDGVEGGVGGAAALPVKESNSTAGQVLLLGGTGYAGGELPSCVALTLGDGEHWQDLPPMHCCRTNFACVAVAGCIIVAGGSQSPTPEVYDEALNR